MTKLAWLTPSNLLTEKTKFFGSDTYEPQFEYENAIESDTAHFYGLPQQKFFDHAMAMLMQNPRTAIRPERATTEQVTQAVQSACKAAGLPSLKLDFSPNHLSQLRIEKTTLHVLTPIRFTVAQLNGKIHHEIETHYLRLLNNSILGLELPSESYDFRSTEEGLANLHSYIDEPTAIMRKTFQSYAGCFLAQNLGFRAVFDQLVKLGVSEEMAWSITTRNKRGLTDTGLPGGFTKDRTYLEGAVKVWQWLLTPHNDIHDLYSGRISLNQVEETKKLIANLATPPTLHFPEFIADQTQYLTRINQIGTTNQFDKLI